MMFIRCWIYSCLRIRVRALDSLVSRKYKNIFQSKNKITKKKYRFKFVWNWSKFFFSWEISKKKSFFVKILLSNLLFSKMGRGWGALGPWSLYFPVNIALYLYKMVKEFNVRAWYHQLYAGLVLSTGVPLQWPPLFLFWTNTSPQNIIFL